METESQNFINLGIVTNNLGEVLVIRRVKEEQGKDGKILKWAFPGGKQKFGESRNDCVIREVLDETGYNISSVKEIGPVMHPEIVKDGKPIFVVYHFCQLNNPSPAKNPSQPWEITEVKWVKPEELKNLFTTSLNPSVAQELKIAPMKLKN